ncbi:hypothetical protein [Paraburkholderia rhynchosiae]|uniref:hypothetical protein n=1 Tax=Paraburkholderia rhynchosiae TaxID=487049 RepID=UPI0011AEF81E|nr:hypothetical protein [Paraburkholderia rhynchosiae]
MKNLPAFLRESLQSKSFSVLIAGWCSLKSLGQRTAPLRFAREPPRLNSENPNCPASLHNNELRVCSINIPRYGELSPEQARHNLANGPVRHPIEQPPERGLPDLRQRRSQQVAALFAKI